MPDVRDARVRKRETSETFSRSRKTAFTAFSRSRAAGRPGREAFTEGPNEASQNSQLWVAARDKSHQHK